MKYNTIFYYSEADQSYVASVPRLPGCMSDGKTIEEAIANTQKIIPGQYAPALFICLKYRKIDKIIIFEYNEK